MRQIMYLCFIAVVIIGALALSPAFTTIYSEELPRVVAISDEFLRYYDRDDAVDIYPLYDAANAAKLSRDASASRLRKEKLMTGMVTKVKVSSFHLDLVNGHALFSITVSCRSDKGPVTLTMVLRKEVTWKISSYEFTMT